MLMIKLANIQIRDSFIVLFTTDARIDFMPQTKAMKKKIENKQKNNFAYLQYKYCTINVNISIVHLYRSYRFQLWLYLFQTADDYNRQHSQVIW